MLRHLNGVDLDIVEAGAGTAVVFSHGGASDLRFWEPQREAFSAGHRFVAYSQRGRGESAPLPAGADPVEASVDDLVSVLRWAGPERIHLVGFSSAVGLRAAIVAPELLRSLTIIEPNAPWFLEGAEDGTEVLDLWRAANARLSTAAAADPDEVARGWFELVNNRGAGMFEDQPESFRRMWLENFGGAGRTATPPAPVTCADVASISVPTLVLGAEHGMRYSRRIADLVAGCIPGSSLVVVAGVTHFMSYQAPDAFSKIVLDFIARTR